MDSSNTQNNNQDSTQKANDQYAQKCAQKLLSNYNSVNSSKTSIQAYCQGKGFSYLNGLTQTQTTVVKPLFARQRFLRYLDTCANIMTEKYQEIDNFKKQFSEQYAYVFRKVVPHVEPKAGRLKILCLDYIKKPDYCFMSYTIMNYDFKLNPNVLKKKIENFQSEKTGFNLGVQGLSIGFNSSSSSHYSTQQLIEQDRGMTNKDMTMLIELANVKVGENTRAILLKMFAQDQFQGINY